MADTTLEQLNQAIADIKNTPSNKVEYNGNSLQSVVALMRTLMRERGTRIFENATDMMNTSGEDSKAVIVKSIGVFTYNSITETPDYQDKYPALGGGTWKRVMFGMVGAAGASVTGASINEAGHLILTRSIGLPIDAGLLPEGPQGVSFTGATINEAGHLILTRSAGSPIDAGLVPDGPVGPKGDNLRIEGFLESEEDLPTDPPDSIGAYRIPDSEDSAIVNLWVWNVGDQQWENTGPLTAGGASFTDPDDYFLI